MGALLLGGKIKLYKSEEIISNHKINKYSFGI